MNLSTSGRSSQVSKAPSGVFEKAVVLEVGIANGQISPAAASVPVSVDRIPRNTILVRRVGDVAGTPTAVCYPFFSSHIQLPVKPGETVWVYFDTPIKNSGYWLSRVHGDEYAEDVNFSHYDRSIINGAEESQTVKLAERTGNAPMPEYEDFPNNSMMQSSEPNDGNGSEEDVLPVVDEYENIVNGSVSIRNARLEPIPRLTKRVGDTVLQGSNNTAIILGTSRGWKKEDEDFSETNAKISPIFESGAIDIVTGRSRYIGTGVKRTIPEVYMNSRLFSESLKDGNRREVSQNPAEGDPDFYNDASRIYVSMSSTADIEFSLESSLPTSLTLAGKEVSRNVSPSIVMKSDELRIVARQSLDNKVNGSIKIVKEGDSSNDAASIMLLPDGTIQMSALRFIIGRGEEDGGAADGPEEDDNVEKFQPYVKYKQLEDLLKAIMADIKSFCDTLSTHTTPGYGAPSPQINQAASSLKSAMGSREGEIVNLKSTRIFGE
jgi:hypothetical protein